MMIRLIVLAGVQEYYDLLTFSPRREKKKINRCIWCYHIVRTFLYYSRFSFLKSIELE